MADDKQVPSGQWWTVRVYLDGEMDPQVYVRTKHVWWRANNTELCILHYYEDGSHRYVSWLREHMYYYTTTREDAPGRQDTLQASPRGG
jgi:hypothetical protein